MDDHDWRVRVGGVGDLDVLEPLWVAVHHRHAQAMPHLGPYVGDTETCAVRRELYGQLLTKPDTLLAYAEDILIGYGLAHVHPKTGYHTLDEPPGRGNPRSCGRGRCRASRGASER